MHTLSSLLAVHTSSISGQRKAYVLCAFSPIFTKFLSDFFFGRGLSLCTAGVECVKFENIGWKTAATLSFALSGVSQSTVLFTFFLKGEKQQQHYLSRWVAYEPIAQNLIQSSFLLRTSASKCSSSSESSLNEALFAWIPVKNFIVFGFSCTSSIVSVGLSVCEAIIHMVGATWVPLSSHFFRSQLIPVWTIFGRVTTVCVEVVQYLGIFSWYVDKTCCHMIRCCECQTLGPCTLVPPVVGLVLFLLHILLKHFSWAHQPASTRQNNNNKFNQKSPKTFIFSK